MTPLVRPADLCIVAHRTDPERPRRALDGLRVCEGHYGELEKLIAEMPARYDDLTRPLGARSTRGSSAPGLTIDEAAADLRRHMEGLLASWCAVVVDERGVTAPAGTEIWRTAPWLTIHVEWCAAQPFVAEMIAELRGATGRSYGIADIPSRYLELGDQCLTHTGGERCEGVVTLVVRGDEWTAICPACRDRHKQAGVPYEAQDATPYLRAGQRSAWVTADDVIRLAAAFGIACNIDVIYQWKRRKHIAARRGTTENEYELGSVQRYLVRRQTEARRLTA